MKDIIKTNKLEEMKASGLYIFYSITPIHDNNNVVDYLTKEAHNKKIIEDDIKNKERIHYSNQIHIDHAIDKKKAQKRKNKREKDRYKQEQLSKKLRAKTLKEWERVTIKNHEELLKKIQKDIDNAKEL